MGSSRYLSDRGLRPTPAWRKGHFLQGGMEGQGWRGGLTLIKGGKNSRPIDDDWTKSLGAERAMMGAIGLVGWAQLPSCLGFCFTFCGSFFFFGCNLLEPLEVTGKKWKGRLFIWRY